MSYLFITHDLATVKAISDEIVVMLRGRIVEQGVKKEILTPPHHEYTALLLASVPEMDPDWLDGILSSRTVKKSLEAARQVQKDGGFFVLNEWVGAVSMLETVKPFMMFAGRPPVVLGLMAQGHGPGVYFFWAIALKKV